MKIKKIGSNFLERVKLYFAEILLMQFQFWVMAVGVVVVHNCKQSNQGIIENSEWLMMVLKHRIIR